MSEIDPLAYSAPRFRLTQIDMPYKNGSGSRADAHRLVVGDLIPGIPKEFTRQELLYHRRWSFTLIGGTINIRTHVWTLPALPPFRDFQAEAQFLGQFFLAPWLRVEAEIDGEWRDVRVFNKDANKRAPPSADDERPGRRKGRPRKVRLSPSEQEIARRGQRLYGQTRSFRKAADQVGITPATLKKWIGMLKSGEEN